MALPIISWRNFGRNAGAVITSSSTAAGAAAANVKDLRSFTLWIAGSTTSPQSLDFDLGAGGDNADHLLMVNMNAVALGAQIKIYADTSFPPTAVAQGLYTPVSDAVDYKGFTAPGVKRYWRVEFQKGGGFSAAPYVGVCQLGLQTNMSEYVAPSVDPYMADIDAMSPKSIGGHFLGALLRGTKRRGTLSFGGDVGVVRSDFTEINLWLKNRARRREPWGLVLDSADSDFSAARWLKVPDDQDTPLMPVGGSYGRFLLSVPFEEAMMEAP